MSGTLSVWEVRLRKDDADDTREIRAHDAEDAAERWCQDQPAEFKSWMVRESFFDLYVRAQGTEAWHAVYVRAEIGLDIFARVKP